MRIASALALLTLLMLLLSAAPSARDEFLSEESFALGTGLDSAGELLSDTKTWEIRYRVDTPQTSQIACRWRESVIYVLGFYQGACYSIEKRAEIQREDIDPVFKHYIDLYGSTAEATQSRDGKLFFARWNLRDHEIEITAYIRDNGAYSIILEESNTRVAAEADLARERELADQPMEIDPLTGKPRPASHVEQDGADEGQDSQDGEKTEQKDKPKEEEKQPPKDEQDESGSGDDDSEDGWE